MKLPTLDEFQTYVSRLNKHDWYYDFSDDGKVYRAGLAEQVWLSALKDKHHFYKEAFIAVSDFYRGNGDVGNRGEIRDKAIAKLTQELKEAHTTALLTTS